ncbi:unnamed protein product [Effrenium voratum]|nr:unnamed protein product [Effrenium voratum]|mmetsp:Transcript_29730/g.70666  ORF Transcript_29730/g.70666 Transcript_29730/m.70666 type:complete len:526 (-) Transcript_29730:86-1663(-)|eukprot:CAMPEP_0181459800 /NCGR_PEP_ID=MMETSP1110-20121109/33013_1 /TAXON_ID=174948 /ORGANISM="Symbiodinium sp., Strain CCMP421" /LENGTH=525 /DNA_ID=CAMNT_0023584333 /DNA_START=81 /DNA_END=1658 /DNA_ORIENTATION=-
MYGHAGREIIPLCNKQVDVDNLKEIRDAPEKRRQNKIQEIRAGASLLQRNGRFPSNRPCQDCAWAVLFGVVVMAVVGFCVYYSQEIDTTINDDSDFINGRTHDHLSVEDINHLALTVNLAGIAGTVASLFVAFFYMTAAHSCPRPIVYTSLYLVPALSILGGAVMLYFGFSRLNDPHLSEEKQGASYSFLFSGLALMAMGMCYGFCVFCCWSRYIPFTIQVLEMVADVSSQNPCMIVVSVLGACASSVWIVMVSVCYAMTMLKHEKDYANQNKHLMTPLDFVFVLTLGWGCGVIAMVCHTAYCGVFTRWYFAQPGNYLWKSLRVALTTSFGSICFGSFTIAAIRAVEALVKSAQRQASSDGNMVGCVLLCILDMLIGCIGDLLEYFNDWVYVQCALRGTSFCESVKTTYSLIVCNNVQSIIADLLISSVVSLGGLLCGLVGACVGAAMAYGRCHDHDHPYITAVGALVGLIGGFVGGGTALQIFSSGSKAILVCWAEDPDPLRENHEYEDIHTELNAKIHDAEYN